MRQYDPGLRLVACGSSGSTMPTFGEWERVVLEETCDLVDEISLHAYYEEGDDLAGFLASGVDLDRSIEQVAAIIDDVGRRSGSDKRVGIAVDEWNVWYLSRHLERFHPVDWPEAPALCEDAYTVADAVVVGGLLISLLRHADRVTSACLAQLVNTIAPIKTVPGGPAWREATFYPFALAAAHARGQVLQSPVTAPRMETSRYGSVPVLDVAATLDDDGVVSLFVVNRHPGERVTLDVGAVTGDGWHVVTAVVIDDEDMHAVNTLDDPLRVRPRDLGAIIVEGRHAQAVLPPASWSLVRLRQGWPAGPTRSLASA
jgi:alpha-N-arabinofuranosidase